MNFDWTINVPTLFGGAAFATAMWRFSLTIARKFDKLDTIEKNQIVIRKDVADVVHWNHKQDRAIMRLETHARIPPLDMG